MPAAPTQILSLRDVTFPQSPPYDIGLQNCSFTLTPGDFALVQLDPTRRRTPLADAACGLLDLESGQACFLEKDWRRLGPSAAANRRGQIGRVFADHPWVSNLNVDENVLLPHVHHRHGSLADLRQRAAELAKHFGLADLPSARPVATSADDLKRAACVRAFLGDPCLLILELPTRGVPDLLAPLRIAIAAARARGAAVLWLDTDPAITTQLADLKPTLYRFDNGTLT